VIDQGTDTAARWRLHITFTGGQSDWRSDGLTKDVDSLSAGLAEISRLAGLWAKQERDHKQIAVTLERIEPGNG